MSQTAFVNKVLDLESAERDALAHLPDTLGGRAGELLPLTLLVIEHGGSTHAVGLQEPIHLRGRPQAQETTQVRRGEMAELVFLERERFKRAAREVAARRLEPLGKFVGYMQGHVHVAIVLSGCRRAERRE